MKTLEQLAGWILFSLSALLVYGFLSLFLIGPTHASSDPGGIFEWLSSQNWNEPTFAQMEWEQQYAPNTCICPLAPDCPGDDGMTDPDADIIHYDCSGFREVLTR